MTAASGPLGSWGGGAPPLDCVVFMLVRNGHVLAEKRKATRRLAPGAIALPGGHVDGDEGLDVDRTAVAEYVRLSRSG